MQLTEILSNKVLDYPLVINTDNLVVELIKIFDDYKKYVNSIINKNYNLHLSSDDQIKIEKTIDIILRVFERYLSGEVAGAYNTLLNLIKLQKAELDFFCLENRTKELLPFENLYRLRASNAGKLSRKDIFHVPYSKRKYVNSYRFSIPGLPAIYLGSSLYVCWEEMSRISLDELYVSRFRFNVGESVSLLNLSYTNKLLLNHLEEFPEEQLDASEISQIIIKSIHNYFNIWPLIAACGIKVQNTDAPFKPEYIIPQLLMQYIGREKQYDGIMFSSTRIGALRVDPKKCINVVLPVRKQDTKTDYCPVLAKKIVLSEPLSIKFYKTTIHKGFGTYAPTDFELIKGLSTNYSLTDFGFIERAVNKLDVEKLT